MQTIDGLPIAGKRVFIRVDFNVPLDSSGEIRDDGRIRSALPTIRHAMAQGGKVIIASHLGRPKGSPAPQYSMRPTADRLAALLGKPVGLAPDCIGQEVTRLVSELQDGDLLMLENLRFHAAEQANDPGFAEQLAALCDVYVNDAFAVCHRANASVEAICRFVDQKCAGFLLHNELTYFDRAMLNPKRPLAAIVGGAKVSSKLNALQNMLTRIDQCLIGGAMANTFLLAQGFSVGRSRVETDLVDAARSIMETARQRGIDLYLPEDVIVAAELAEEVSSQCVDVAQIPADQMALDIGPRTLERFGKVLSEARTVVWNGPMGVFEIAAFEQGTIGLAKTLAECEALTIVGGGDTDAALHKAGVLEKMTYVSTGGGAFLALLEGKTLPAVAALNT